MQDTAILGIDIGASGIKGAVVDTSNGKLLSERIKLLTPQPSLPEAVADTFAELVHLLDWKGDIIGCGFPSIVKKGVACSAANIHKNWIGADIEKLLSQTSGFEVKVLNDADAAGMAEMKLGPAKNQKGTVILITIGSGLGSALFTDGHLVRNSELGHILLYEQIAEKYASNGARKKLHLNLDNWAMRFNEYLEYIDRVFSPDLILLGGGISKKFDSFVHHFTLKTKILPATFRNNAGIIGASMYAADYVNV